MHYPRFALAVTLAFLGACTGPAPKYQASIDNALTLKRIGKAPMRAGQFSALDTANKSLQLRASSMVSPYNDSYADYLREALRNDLIEAGRLDENAHIVVDGVLLKNDMDISGLSLGTAGMSARFAIKRGNGVQFEKEISVTHDWNSDFRGAIAIPMARDMYPVVVQKLLRALYADPDFAAATR